jgi:hypothetical protein
MKAGNSKGPSKVGARLSQRNFPMAIRVEKHITEETRPYGGTVAALLVIISDLGRISVEGGGEGGVYICLGTSKQ